MLWDRASAAGRDCTVIGVPPSYPVKPLNGSMISCFLAPNTESDFTYPSSLKHELAQACPPYILDVRDFRGGDTARTIEAVHRMTMARFAAADYLLSTRATDLFVMVEIGTDRLNHALWSFIDPSHPRHAPGNSFQSALLDYYVAVDAQIGALLDRHADVNTSVVIVSDHGAVQRDGGICFNDWLRSERQLVLRDEPAGLVRFSPELVAWDKTLAWGDGGYYGRLFINTVERAPAGIVPPAAVEGLLVELAESVLSIRGPGPEPFVNEALRPRDIYRTVNGFPPDLMATFGDLRWRSFGSCGHTSIYAYENDTGLDEANHARHGICIVASDDGATGRREGLHLYDVAPTILDLLHLGIDGDALGESLV
jgi:predicted AlkP superfamily phosphohydrolase/phosphomutase